VKKIMVTGALGHIGSRLIRYLPKHFPDAEFVLVDNLMTQRFSSLFSLSNQIQYKFLELDVAKKNVDAVVKECDVVIHLAAITDATGSFGRAKEVEENNFRSTEAIANACLYAETKLVHLSTTSVYGVQDRVVDEDCPQDQLRPQSPYATTKLKEEGLIKQMSKDRGLNAVSCRFGTIAGVSKGMRFHTAVNKFCWQAVMGQRIQVWRSALNQKRPYLDLDDACDAIRHLIQKVNEPGSIYNVITANHTVQQIVDEIRVTIPDAQYELVDSPIMNQFSYEVSARKIQETGWQKKGSIQRAIRETIGILRGANHEASNVPK
jgi:UDP-glucose 4-epimerase